MDKDLESIQEARSAVDDAYRAWTQFEHASEEQVERILEEISKAGVAHATELAQLAVAETGYGNVEHKILKNLFCADEVYRAIRPMKTIGIVAEDPARKVFEVASPLGVVAAIIPSTNPTSTTIYKALIALKGRNAIVFSPHPSAVKCIQETARRITAAAERAGAPAGLIRCLSTPTMEGTDALMKHPRTAVILATGGLGLVRAAYSAGKPAYGVGPGNVPSYIDRTANIEKAVRDILTGKTFDNGTLCSSEQAIVCDAPVRDAVLAQLKSQGAHICTDSEKALLERTIQTPRRTLNTKIVGQSAEKIASMAGIAVPSGTRALVAFATGVGPEFPISMEKLSPCLAFYEVRDWREGCERCKEILTFGGLGHTLSLHTENEDIVRQFGLEKPAYRICVNTPSALGAVGYTTNLFPSMTLGCGAFGGNITSDNISPMHLINLKRVAYGVRDVAAPKTAPPSVAPSVAASVPVSVVRREHTSTRDTISSIVDQWLSRKSAGAAAMQRPPASPKVEPDVRPPVPPPLASFKDLPEVPVNPRHQAPGKAVAFVCEDDVRRAIRDKTRIVVGRRTIITPSARDLGEANDTFIPAD